MVLAQPVRAKRVQGKRAGIQISHPARETGDDVVLLVLKSRQPGAAVDEVTEQWATTAAGLVIGPRSRPCCAGRVAHR